MADAYTTLERLIDQANGSNDEGWGDKADTNFSLITEMVSAFESHDVAAADLTLSSNNGATDQARKAMHKFTGTLAANRTVIALDDTKKYLVWDATTHDGNTLTIKTATGTGVTLEAGELAVVFSDGTNMVKGPSTAINIVTDTTPQLGGQLDVNGNALGDGTLELLKFIETGSAVNEWTMVNAATGSGPDLQATGDDTHISPKLTPKGNGGIRLDLLRMSALDGLILSNDTDSEHDISMGLGCATLTDDSGFILAANTSALVKQIDANWAAGSAAGGFPSGLSLTADTWYHFFIVAKEDGTVDGGFDSSLSATNLLADTTGYTYYRRIGSVLTDGSSNIIGFAQVGDKFLWSDPPLDVNVSNLDSTAVLYALSIPTGVKVDAAMNARVFQATTDRWIYLSSPDASDEASSITAAPLLTMIARGSTVNAQNTAQKVEILSDTSSQIRGRSSLGSTTLLIATLGWTDPRGRTV